MDLGRSLELRSGAYRAPALPVELYQRSWRGGSNADRGLTRPVLFPLSYTSKTLEVAGELHSRCSPHHRAKNSRGGDPASVLQADALLSWLRHPKQSGAEYGNCTRVSGLAIRGTAPVRTPHGASSES